MSKAWYPIIDYDKCIGCMACYDMCKHGVYKPNGETGKPKVVYGNGCVHGCHGCEKKCPVGAIHYYGNDGLSGIDDNFETYKPELDLGGRKPRVAFVCVHNSCRSQIAEALGKLYASDVFESYSAGTELKDHINPDAVRLIKVLYNIDMEESQWSKLIADIPEPDIVIFMGCNVSCPSIHSQYTENWGLDDPSGKPDDEFMKIIEQIDKKVRRLSENLKKYFMEGESIMSKMSIYEPAMCCDTGICGVGVDHELIRISTILNALKKNGVEVKRYNLSNFPQEFVSNADINKLLNDEGVDALPATVVDGKIVKTKAYPTNGEIVMWLNISPDALVEKPDDGGGCCGPTAAASCCPPSTGKGKGKCC